MSAGVHMYGPMERILHLKSISALSAVPTRQLVELAAIATERFFRAGTEIVAEGAPVRAVYILMDGEAEIHWKGLRQEVRAGQGLNWLRLLGRRGTSRRAVATRDVVAMEIPASDLLDLMELNPDIIEDNIRRFTNAVIHYRGKLPRRSNPDAPLDLGTWPAEPIDLVQRIALLEESGSMWKNANMDTLVTVARQLREVRLSAGTRLFEIGDAAEVAYAIRYGQVRCTDDEGHTADVGSDFGLGFFDAVAGRARSHDAVCVTDVVAMRFDMASMFSVLESNPRAALGVLAQTAAQFADLHDAVRFA